MIKICEMEAYYLDMKFNAAKSMILRVGYGCNVICAKLFHDGCELQFICKLKYLGVYLLSGKKLRPSLQEPKAKFFKALNGVLYSCKRFIKWNGNHALEQSILQTNFIICMRVFQYEL